MQVWFIFLLVVPGLFLCAFLIFWRKFYVPLKYTNKILNLISSGNLNAYRNFAASSPVCPDLDIVQILNLFEAQVYEEYKAGSLQDHTTIQMLQGQINPHFLYNALENIRSIALKENVQQIADMTEALALFFRYNISYKGEIITLEEELANVQHYFFIQQFRFNNSFRLKILLDGCDASVYQQIIPKLTLQPLIENAVYHGLEPKIGDKEIKIRLTETEKRMIIMISDNGIGMPEEKLAEIQNSLSSSQDSGGPFSREDKDISQHNGIALTNINKRIHLLFGSEYGLSVTSTPDIGTNIEITLPLMNHSDMVDYEKRNT